MAKMTMVCLWLTFMSYGCAKPMLTQPVAMAGVPIRERQLLTSSLSCRETWDCDLLASRTCGHYWRTLEQSDRGGIHLETVECMGAP
jgi:hypothetical protein